MITKKEFHKFISSYQEFYNGLERFERAITGKKFTCNLLETDWGDAVGRMLDAFLESHFTEHGIDLITWWLFEDVDKIIYKDEEIIAELHTVEDLYNYIKNNKELWKEPLQK